jgi:hypothetical protein
MLSYILIHPLAVRESAALKSRSRSASKSVGPVVLTSAHAGPCRLHPTARRELLLFFLRVRALYSSAPCMNV